MAKYSTKKVMNAMLDSYNISIPKTLKGIEKFRITGLKALTVLYSITAMIIIASIVALFIAGLMAAGIIFFFAIVLSFICSLSIRSFRRAVYNGEIFQKMLNEILPGAVLDKERTITNKVVRNCGICPYYDRIYSDLNIKGTYKEVDFYFSSFNMSEIDNSKSLIKVNDKKFKGAFFAFDYKDDKFGTTRVFEKGYLDKMLSGSFKQVETEGILFNKKFNVYTEDEQKAFYFLSPYVQESMLNIENKFKGRVSFAYHAGFVFVAIDSAVISMDIKMTKPIKVQLDELAKKLEFIPELIESLQLTSSKYSGFVNSMDDTL